MISSKNYIIEINKQAHRNVALLVSKQEVMGIASHKSVIFQLFGELSKL